MVEPSLTKQERARRMRREVYLRAKELRAKDPKYLAMKAALKLRRRKAYELAKERRKIKAQGEKIRLDERKAEERAAADLELMAHLKSGARGR